ncbi:hypothetical protein V3C99_010196 [Haemonchus contortus]
MCSNLSSGCQDYADPAGSGRSTMYSREGLQVMVDQSVEEMDVNSSDPQPAPKMKISFGVKRVASVKLQDSTPAIVDVSVDSDEEREHDEEERRNKKRKLTHFEDGDAPDDEDSKKKAVAVIPLVQERDWRVAKLLALQKEGKLTDEDRAKLAILTEDQPFEGSNGTATTDAIVVEEEAKVVEDADYGAVPIEEYGLAILRGCGWKEGQGIGRRPQVVPLRILPRRPNGLGLGAVPQKQDKKGAKNDKDEQLDEVIKKDSLIRITTGRFKGHYGKVESRDDDNNCLFVRLAVGGQQVKVSLFAIQQVSKKEYDRDSKCINKDDYDKEREKIEKRNNEAVRDGRKRDDRNDREERSRDKYREKDTGHDRKAEKEELWVRTDLLVRFIDENYKKGKYFKEKMRVVDVASRKDISLEDSHGKMHYGIRQSSLETVLPRLEKSRVMIVRGKHKGHTATMEEKDKKRCLVVARLLRSNEIITVDFDDVCQHQPKDEDDDDDY